METPVCSVLRDVTQHDERVSCFGFWTWAIQAKNNAHEVVLFLFFYFKKCLKYTSHPHPPATMNDNTGLNMNFSSNFLFHALVYPRVGPIFMGYFCGCHILLIRKIESEMSNHCNNFGTVCRLLQFQCVYIASSAT